MLGDEVGEVEWGAGSAQASDDLEGLSVDFECVESCVGSGEEFGLAGCGESAGGECGAELFWGEGYGENAFGVHEAGGFDEGIDVLASLALGVVFEFFYGIVDAWEFCAGEAAAVDGDGVCPVGCLAESVECLGEGLVVEGALFVESGGEDDEDAENDADESPGGMVIEGECFVFGVGWRLLLELLPHGVAAAVLSRGWPGLRRLVRWFRS